MNAGGQLEDRIGVVTSIGSCSSHLIAIRNVTIKNAVDWRMEQLKNSNGKIIFKKFDLNS